MKGIVGWLGSAAVNAARAIAKKATNLVDAYHYRLVGRIVQIHEESMTVEVCLSVDNYAVRFDMVKTRYPQTIEEYNNGDAVPILEGDSDKVFIQKLYPESTFHTKPS